MTIELNVTLSPFAVRALSSTEPPIDQTEAIRFALSKLGKKYLDVQYGNEARFPGGYYYVSAKLASLLKSNSHITLCGDGYGQTFIQRMPGAYYESTALKDCLSTSTPWAVSGTKQSEEGNVTLSITSAGASGNRDTVLPEFVCGNSSELIIRTKRWLAPTDGGFVANSSRFEVFDGSTGGTPIITLTSANADWVPARATLTAGSHTLTFRLVDSATAPAGQVAFSISRVLVQNATVADGEYYDDFRLENAIVSTTDANVPTKWVVSDAEKSELGELTLNVKSSATIENKDVMLNPILCPAAANLIFRRKKWAAGFFTGSPAPPPKSRFQVIVDGGSPVIDEDSVTSNWGNLSVALTAGLHTITFRLVDSTGATDDAVAVTISSLKLEDASMEHTIFRVEGTGGNATGNLSTAGFFSVRDMTLSGSLKLDKLTGDPIAGTNRPLRWFLLDRASQINLDRLVIRDTHGSGIHGKHWQDSVMHDVSFAQVGRVVGTDKQPSMLLTSVGTPTKIDSCNNIKLEASRWEAHQYIACLMDQYTEQIYYLGCKWHGKLLVDGTTPIGPAPVDFPQIDILANYYGICIVAARITNWGNTHLRASGAAAIIISDSGISAAGSNRTGTLTGMYGIELLNCKACAVTSNGFALPGPESTNLHGDVCASGQGNVVANNGRYNSELPLVYNDEFSKGNMSSGTIGNLGWSVQDDGTAGAPTISIPSKISGHPGQVKVRCTTTNGVSGLALTNVPFVTTSDYPFWVDASKFFAVTYVLKFPDYLASDNVGYSFGLRESLSPLSFLPNTGLAFVKFAAAEVWWGQAYNNGSNTSSGSSFMTVDTNYHMFTIRRKATNSIGFTIDGGDEKTISADIPTGMLLPFAVINKAAGSSEQKSFIIDAFEVSLPHFGRT